MTQYVLQIQNTANGQFVGWLAKCFEVTSEYPIPSVIPVDRVQIVMTNTTSYDEIVSVYNQYTDTVFFSYDEPGGTIDCTGAVTDSWPID